MKLITTSWDDGHKADFRLAELLDKYNLPGTFYIPAANNEHAVMDEKDVMVLARRFEVGGHTMNHTRIKTSSVPLFDTEILGCYNWLKNILGAAPVSFCFPGGIYNAEAVRYTLNTGFKVIRTTELLTPWISTGTEVMHTTLQVYPHSRLTYVGHLVKRLKLRSLLLYLRSGSSSDLCRLLEFYLEYIQQHGGCLHLWGHSWEIEENYLWNKLEEVFKVISNISGVEYIANKDLQAYSKLSL